MSGERLAAGLLFVATLAVSAWAHSASTRGPAAESPAPVALRARDAAAIARWPAQGEIVFDVLYGKMAFRLGSATHRWWHDARSYRMESVARAAGLLSAVDALSYTQRSRGDVVALGLRPQAFEVERGGKRREWSDFDWAKGEVALFRDGNARTATLDRGDQDVLSLWHQIGLASPWAGGAVTLSVVTGKSAAETLIEDLGSEAVEVPAGRFEARHLRATANDGSLVLDVWLATAQHHLPVRIRMRDRKGEVLDQQARSIALGDLRDQKPVTEAQ